MGQGINPYQNQQRSPIEGIVAALGAVEKYYGIKGAKETANQIKKQNDPNSQESQAAREGTNLALNFGVKHGYSKESEVANFRNIINGTPAEYNEETGDLINPEKPGIAAAGLAKITEINPLFSLYKGQQSADAMATRYNERNKNTVDRMILGSTKDLDHEMKPYRDVQEGIKRIGAELSTPKVSRQQLALANEYMMNIVTNGHGGGLGRLERSEFDTMHAKIAGLLQSGTGDIFDIGSNGVLDHVKDITQRTAGVVATNALDRLDSLESSLENVQNPQLKKAISGGIINYRGRFSPSDASVSGGSPFPGNEAQAGTGVPGAPGIHINDIQAEMKRRGLTGK